MESGFNAKKFESEQFTDRTSEVKVPELKQWYDGRKKPIWIVKALTGIELARVRDAVSKNQNFDKLLEKITSNLSKNKADAVMSAFGMNEEELPDDYVRRLHILKYGSVDPKLPQDQVIKIAENYPVTFSKLTDEIMILTGAGRLGESDASGTTEK